MKRFIFFTLFLAAAEPLVALPVWYNGRIVDNTKTATMDAEEHYSAGVKALQSCDFYEAARHFRAISNSCRDFVYWADCKYWLAVAEYGAGDFEQANIALTDYLKTTNTPTYFYSALDMKFAIAEKFRGGAKKRLFGSRSFPKWAPSDTYAIEIYDEIAAAVPCSPLSARALFSKGIFLKDLYEFGDSATAFQEVIRRFPREEIAAAAYLEIAQVYRIQAGYEIQNSDLLSLAEINLNRFENAFPQDERVQTAACPFQEIQELYAFGLYQTAKFYERTEKTSSAHLYHSHVKNRFPTTSVANLCSQSLPPPVTEIEDEELGE